MRFNNKVVVITGCAQRQTGMSLGVGYAEAFAAEGCSTLVLVDVRKEALTKTAASIREKFPNVNVVDKCCDIRYSEVCASLMREVYETFGSIDILVNNAGVVPDSKDEQATKAIMYRRKVQAVELRMLDSFTDDNWLKFWDVNVHGTFWCTREALKFMYEQRQGSIINIASIAAFGPAAGFSPGYAASKAAIIGMTKALADEAARFGVRINVFAPSAPDDGSWEKLSEEKVGVAKRSVPLGRLGTLKEYANAVLFLADDGYMVGQVLSSNGGIHI